MRPLLGGDALPSSAKPRSRKSSVDHPAVASSNVPTAFFMKREEDLEQSSCASPSTDTLGRSRESTFGVQSLADTLEAAFPAESTAGRGAEGYSYIREQGKDLSRSGSRGSSAGSAKRPESSKSSPVQKLKRKLSSHGSPIPFVLPTADVPLSIPASAIPSTPKSVSLHSLKLSDEESALDDVASQAITSSGEEEEDASIQQTISSSFPQLVMPSIQMPTRRPFTTKGKAMGKLKILVAGEAGMFSFRVLHAISMRATSNGADMITQASAKHLSFDQLFNCAKTSST